MKKSYEGHFDEIFQSESLRGERIHLRFNWFLYTTVFIFGAVVYMLQNNIAGLYGMILAVINLMYNIFVTIIISRKKRTRWVGYSTIILNVITLTMYNYIDACNNSSILTATSATMLLYPVIIFLASLRMDRNLILFTSVLSIAAMNGLYFWFHDSFDPSFHQQPMSIDILSQLYRTFYLIIIASFIYSVPLTIKRILRRQEQLAKESFKNQQKAYHDVLTGLYNRLYFEQHLTESIQEASLNKQKVALLFIDLDRFKYLNDTYGHEVGDFTLRAVAEDLIALSDETHSIARLGGDEFVITISQIFHKREVQDFAFNVYSIIEKRRRFQNIDIQVGASIGIAFYPDDAENLELLIKYADKAMYQAKKSEEEKIICYTLGK